MAETVNEPRPAHETYSVADAIEREVREGKRVLSPLGEKLVAARRRIEESGEPLLTFEELEAYRDELRTGRL